MIAFLVANPAVECRVLAQLQQRAPQRRRELAPHQEPSARIDAGERVGVRERQFRLSDPAQPVDSRDHAGLFVGQSAAQFEQFVESSRELLVVRRNFVFALRRPPRVPRPLIEVACEFRQDVANVLFSQRGTARVVKRPDRVVQPMGHDLPATDLLNDGRQFVKESAPRLLPAQSRDRFRYLQLGQHRLGVEAGHFDEINRGRAFAELMRRDLAIDPRAPLAAANVAGEVGGRQKRQEQSRLDEVLLEDLGFPRREVGNAFRVEEVAQHAATAEPLMLLDNAVDKLLDEAQLIVGPRVGDKEVVIRPHDGTPASSRQLHSRSAHGRQGSRRPRFRQHVIVAMTPSTRR